MELNFNGNAAKSLNDSERVKSLIQVRATISCPTCEYRRKFKNQFQRKDIELMVVALKVFDWLTCNHCGELLWLDLEFQI